jgi:hypothetical protein
VSILSAHHFAPAQDFKEVDLPAGVQAKYEKWCKDHHVPFFPLKAEEFDRANRLQTQGLLAAPSHVRKVR